tara:strand:- start:1113 stop:2063 length:951 start_codon:yes stop_codon:yes gene_type:complete
MYLLAFVLLASNSYAISATTSSKVSDGVAIERIQAYAASSTKSEYVGIVEPGTDLIEHTTFMKTKPGFGVMEDNSWDKSVPFDRGSTVYIWEYIGDGYSKVTINGVRYNTKVARSKTECNRFAASPKYCWIKVIEEPEYYEWKQVSLTEDGQRFWILNRIIDASGIITLKDRGVEKSRVVKTNYEEKPKKLETEVTEEKQNNALLLAEELKTENIKENSLESNTAKNLALSPEERKKAREEAKAKLRGESINDEEETKPAELTQEQIFKQQNIKELEANITAKSTKETMNSINKELAAPATKLKLEKNKPLELPEV